MFEKIRQFLFGPPKDVHDQHTFHSLSLIRDAGVGRAGSGRALVLCLRPRRGLPAAHDRKGTTTPRSP